MADDLKRVGLVFRADGSTDFVKTLKEINIEMNKNYNDFKLVQGQWDKSTTSIQKMRSEQEYLKNAYEIQSDKVTALRMQLEELEGAENKNVTAIKKKRNELTSAEIKLESYNKKIKDIENQLNNTGKKIEEFGNKIQEKGKKVEGAGKKLSAFSAATIAAFTASAKGAIEFESAFAGVEKTVNATDVQLEELKAQIRQMAKEIPSSTTEISAVAEAAGQLGIKTEDIMSFTRVMIDLGNSTNLSAEEAASALAKFANVTKMSASNYSNLGSVVVALGNNFATTEADIVSMATKLAATGELTGLTEPQIMALAAAMSSVGIEAEAGGTAMSKLLKQIQVAVETGSKDLDDFAHVAGMTSEDFKKAFQEDSVKALSAFISGLNDTERNGKSAVAVLNDMGIKEVRLSNTILSLANSSDLMNNAVELANKSWKENNALSNEANKRYDTLQSKMKVALNKIQDIGITVGNKLMPTIEKVINKIEKWTKKFDKLDESQIDTIVKIGMVVAAIGPLLTILGKMTSTVGGAVKGFGTFVEAIGVMQGKVEASSTSVAGLAKVLSGALSPIGLLAGAIGVAVFATNKLRTANDENNVAIANSTTELENLINQYSDLTQKKDNAKNITLSEATNTEKLSNELEKLVDENGRVKDGYEERVSFILTELNKAYGTEYKMTGDVIEKYSELKTTMQKLIEQKRINAILENEEAKYDEAINQKASAYDTMIQKEKELATARQGLQEIQEKLNDEETKRSVHLSSYYRAQEDIQKRAVQEAENNFNTSKNLYNNYLNDIATYENDFAVIQNGNTEEIKALISARTLAYQQGTNDIGETINKNIEQIQYELEQYKQARQQDLDNQDYINAEKNQRQITANELQLQTLANQLLAMTSTTEEATPQQIEAWRNLATESYDTYFQTVAPLDETIRQKIEQMTGVTAQKTPELVTATQVMAQQVLDQIEKNPEFKQQAINNLQGMLSGLEDEQLRQLLKNAGIANADEVIKGIKAGNLAEDTGKQILNSLKTGLDSPTWQNSLFSVARGIASTLSGLLTVKANVNGNMSSLPGHKSGLDYVPRDNYIARLHKGERVLTKEENEEYSNPEKQTKRNSKLAINTNDYSKLAEAMVTAISTSNARIENLLSKILEKSSKTICLDTGELVGATTEKYDVALASNQVRRERGN